MIPRVYSAMRRLSQLVVCGCMIIVSGCSTKSVPDVVVGRITKGRIQYAVVSAAGQSIMREYDVKSQKIVSETTVDGQVVGIVPQAEDTSVMVLTVTPSGRSTIQPYNLNPKSGKLSPVFQVDESFRYPALHVGKHLIYNRRTEYLGAMGGQPWKLDRELWVAEGGSERPLGVEAFVTEDFHSLGDAPFALVCEYHDSGTSRIRLLSPEGKIQEFDVVREVGNLALSSKGRFLAIGTYFDPTVEVFDTSSAKVVATHRLRGRCVALLFDETVQLWAVMQQAGRAGYLWRCDPEGAVLVTQLP